MITQYKHTFTGDSATKMAKIVITSKDCGKDCNYVWKASGSSYTGGERVTSGKSGTSLFLKNSNMKSCTSVWDVWCEEVPEYRVNIILEKYGCVILDGTALVGGGEGSFGGIDEALKKELDKYKDFVEEKYQELDNKVANISEEVDRDLEYAKDKSKDILDNAISAQAEAQTKIENAKTEIANATRTLQDIQENQLNVEELADGLGKSATFLNKVSGTVSEVLGTMAPEIGGFIESAKTINTLLSSVTSYDHMVNTVSGIISTQLENIDTVNGKVTNLNELWDAVNGSITSSVKTVSGNIVSDVQERLASGEWVVSASVANVESSAVTFGDRTLDMWLGHIVDELYVVDADGKVSGTKHLMTSGEVETLVERLNEDGTTEYSAIKQELSAITSVVKGKDGTYSGIMQKDKNVLIAVNYVNKETGEIENSAAINLGSINGEGDETSIVLDADRVVVPGDMLVAALSANTISLGQDNSKFFGDGSGYLAKSAITWTSTGNLSIENADIKLKTEQLQAIAKEVKFDASSIKFTAEDYKTVASYVEISADTIKLEGYTSINDGFTIDLDGNLKAKSGKFSGFIQSEPFTVGDFNLDSLAYYGGDGVHISIEQLSPYIYFLDTNSVGWWSNTLTTGLLEEKKVKLTTRENIYIDLPFQASYTVDMKKYIPNIKDEDNMFPDNILRNNIQNADYSLNYLEDIYSLQSWLTYHDTLQDIKVHKFDTEEKDKAFNFNLLDKYVGCELTIRLGNETNLFVLGTEMCPDKYFNLRTNQDIFLGTHPNNIKPLEYKTLKEYNYVHLKLVRRKIADGFCKEDGYIKKFSFPEDGTDSALYHGNEIKFTCDNSDNLDGYEYVWVIDYETRYDSLSYRMHSIKTFNDLASYDSTSDGISGDSNLLNSCLRNTVEEPYYSKLPEYFTNMKPRISILEKDATKNPPYYIFNLYSLRGIKNEFNSLKQKYKTLMSKFDSGKTEKMKDYFEIVEILVEDLLNATLVNVNLEYSVYNDVLTPIDLFEQSNIYKDCIIYKKDDVSLNIDKLNSKYDDTKVTFPKVNFITNKEYVECEKNGTEIAEIIDFEDYFYTFYIPFYKEYINLCFE